MYKIFRYQRWVLPVSGMKDSKEILEFYYHLLQCGVKVASVTCFPPTERGVNSPDRKVGEGAPPGEEEGAGCRGKLGGSRCDSSVMRLRDEVSDEVA
jgi:hypothetical protein